MTFVSASFIIFLLILFILYYSLPRSWQWPLLLVAGYIFYAFAGPTFLLYVAVTTITAWYGASRIYRLQLEQKDYLAQNKSVLDRDGRKQYKAKMKKRQQSWFWSTLLINIGMLAIVKYTDFVIFNINELMSVFETGARLDFLDIALPLGMSFYTFQTVGYVIDVYRAKHPPEKNLFRLALFVSFFPQMIQGPISRYSDLAPDLYGRHKFDSNKFSLGIQRILWGFFKKVVIADRIIAAVSTIFQEPDQYRGIYVFVGMLFYALQLYADFTGGIDITIGIAQALGIGLKENFERPFFAKSTAEYWRRWHITMGTWFRDYIFYPLSVSKPMLKLSSGSRKLLGSGFGRRLPVYVSTLIVWFTTGLWHGSSWNFVVWGLLNGLVIIISQEFEPLYTSFHKRFSVADKTWFRLFQVMRTFFLMASIRLLDCYRDVGLTFRQYVTMFTEFDLNDVLNGSMMDLGLTYADYVLLVISTIMLTAVSLVQRQGSVRTRLATKPLVLRYVMFSLLFISILLFGAYGIGYDSNQFIYNQF